MLTERLGCNLAPMFAAIATVAGPLAAPIAATCHAARPLAVLEIQGTTDQVVPYGGGAVDSGVGGMVLSLQQTTALWSRRDRCTGATKTTALGAAPNDGSGVVLTTYVHCTAGEVVSVASVVGGAHEWPGTLLPIGEPSGGVSPHGFHASAAIWRFLRQFSRTSPA
jgi:polyhydroxybutyrate depolymerase